MHAPEECLLDAIVMSIACDGEVVEEELARAARVLRDLPIFKGRDLLEIESIVGQAFERFVSDGQQARMDALKSVPLDREARIEILTTCAFVMIGEGIAKPEEDFMMELARTIGATDEEARACASAAAGSRGSVNPRTGK